MRWPAIIALVLGLAAVVGLLIFVNGRAVAGALGAAGWGILLVVVVHTPQTVLAAIGWREVILDPARPRFPTLVKDRWIKEAVNALLPVAQVGGDLIRARLLVQKGVQLRAAAASCTVDVAAGLFGLFIYLLVGLSFLVLVPHDRALVEVAMRAVAMAGGVALAVAVVLRLGVFRLIEAGVRRFTDGRAWSSLGDGLDGLHEAVVALFRSPGRLFVCCMFHLAAWMLGTFETYTALRVMGVDASLTDALVIDSLGQGVRAAGFAVPGALGVQEGGYVLICSLFGIPAEQGLALSMIRRIRELALGVPGLLLWAQSEGRGWRMKRAG